MARQVGGPQRPSIGPPPAAKAKEQRILQIARKKFHGENVGGRRDGEVRFCALEWNVGPTAQKCACDVHSFARARTLRVEPRQLGGGSSRLGPASLRADMYRKSRVPLDELVPTEFPVQQRRVLPSGGRCVARS